MKNLKTICYKSHYGWMAETTTEANQNGDAWQISTSKSGKGIKCSAIKGKLSNEMFSYEMFGSEKLQLAFSEGQCTEKKVREIHAAGLIKFEELKPVEENIYTIGIGQIIFTDYIQSSEDYRRVIYEVIAPGEYKTVQLNGKGFHREDRIKPYSQKFGIGVYYNEGEILSIDDVNILVEAANIWIEMQDFKQNEEAQKAAEYKALAISEGAKIIQSIPEAAKSVIVAQLKQDESDHQTDYFASSIQKVVYLSFSTHDKNNFSEMKKAALLFPETAYLNTEGDQYENRENYSGGSGYYLGESKYSGWIICKCSIPALATLQIAAAEGRFLCNEQVQEVENIEPIEVKDGKIQVIEYGSGLAVVGDTKPIKDKLKSLGGRFNFRLTCGAGWVFPKSRLTDLQNALMA